MYIIVGLGNPGLKYRHTRHNAGYMAIEALASRHKLRFSKKRFQGVVAEGSVEGQKVVLLKPQTYMNLSGNAVWEIVDYYRLQLERLIVIYDDVDLDEGRLRIKPSGSAGTHNGMRSIIARLRSKDFPRVRVGIGKNPPYMQLADYVTGKLPKDRRGQMEEAAQRAAIAVEEILRAGVQSAMAKFNGE